MRFLLGLTPVLGVAEDGEIAKSGGNAQDEHAGSPVAIGNVGDEGEALGAGGLGNDVGAIDLDDQIGFGHAFTAGKFDAGLEGLKLMSLGTAAGPVLTGGKAEGREKFFKRDDSLRQRRAG